MLIQDYSEQPKVVKFFQYTHFLNNNGTWTEEKTIKTLDLKDNIRSILKVASDIYIVQHVKNCDVETMVVRNVTTNLF